MNCRLAGLFTTSNFSQFITKTIKKNSITLIYKYKLNYYRAYFDSIIDQNKCTIYLSSTHYFGFTLHQSRKQRGLNTCILTNDLIVNNITRIVTLYFPIRHTCFAILKDLFFEEYSIKITQQLKQHGLRKMISTFVPDATRDSTRKIFVDCGENQQKQLHLNTNNIKVNTSERDIGGCIFDIDGYLSEFWSWVVWNVDFVWWVYTATMKYVQFYKVSNRLHSLMRFLDSLSTFGYQ